MPKTSKPRQKPDNSRQSDDAPQNLPKWSRSAVQLGADNKDMIDFWAKDRNFVWALARGLEVLRAFSVKPAPLGNSELVAITGFHKATISRLTHTLSELGYLNLIVRLGKYEPTPALLALGYPVISSMKARLIARDHIEKLANSFGISVALGSRERLTMIYVDACNPGLTPTLRLEIGSRVDIATSAIGRAYLSSVPPLELKDIFERLSKNYGSEWPDLRERILASFVEIKERGFCIVDGEWRPDVCAIGVPLVSPDRTEIMALNAGGPRFTVNPDTLRDNVGPQLVHLARTISPMLGK